MAAVTQVGHDTPAPHMTRLFGTVTPEPDNHANPMRALKRHISDAVYQRLVADARGQLSLAASGQFLLAAHTGRPHRSSASGQYACVRCDGCGFVWGSIAVELVVPSLREFPSRYAVELARDETTLRRRPSAEVWSALEYACHVRDVLLVMRERVLQVLREPTPPAFTPMGRDERVRHDRYIEQLPEDVTRQLTDAAEMLAFVFEGLDDVQWAKRCVYGYPSPSERTLTWVAQHTVHELHHHLWDVRASLATE